MDLLADELRFVVAYPDAAFREWAAGCDCTRAELEGVDDVRFVGRLIDELDRRLGIDPARAYVVGFSQGALMTFKVGCDLADRLAGVATVAATMLSPVAEQCRPAQPTPMLIVHGTADPEFPPQGRTGESASTISIAATVEKWVEVNGCATTPVTTAVPDTADDGTTVSRNSYGSCSGQVIVEYLTVEDGGHTWPGSPVDFSPQLGLKSRDISASLEIAQLLVQYRRD